MPMVADLPITMLACARLGVVHSQVFSGFSGKATADRIVDSESNVLITMDAYYRGGQLLDHKQKDAMSRDEGRRSFPAISFVQVVIGRKGDTIKWIEQLTPQLMRIGSSAPWS